MLMDAPTLVAELKKLAFSFGNNDAFKAECIRLINHATFSKALIEWERVCQHGKFAHGKQFNSLLACYAQCLNEKDFEERIIRATSSFASTSSGRSNDTIYNQASIVGLLISRIHRFLSFAIRDKLRAESNSQSFFGESASLRKEIDTLKTSVQALTEKNTALEQKFSQLNDKASKEEAAPMQEVRRSARLRR